MFKWMSIIVQTTLITRTKGAANVTKQVCRNIATLSFNFQFQCINCSGFGAISFAFETSPKNSSPWVWGLSKMEHLPTTIAMFELTSMQLFQTPGLDEGVPLNGDRYFPPRKFPPRTFPPLGIFPPGSFPA